MQRLPPTIPFRIAEPESWNAGGPPTAGLDSGPARCAVITAAFMRRRRRARHAFTSDAPCLRRYMAFCGPPSIRASAGGGAPMVEIATINATCLGDFGSGGVQPNRSVTCRGLRLCRRSDAERPRRRSADATASRSSPTGAGFVSTTSKPACAILLRVASSS